LLTRSHLLVRACDDGWSKTKTSFEG